MKIADAAPLLTAVLFSVLATFPNEATAAPPSCFVVSAVPALISAPGNYCLDRNVSTAISSGAAISIEAENVRFDCSGFLVDGLAAGVDTQTVGVRVASGYATVRNCSLRGFYIGVEVESNWTSQPAIEGVVVEDNRISASRYHGIGAQAPGTLIRRNAVSDTGGFSQFGAVGIGANFDAEIVDNVVDGVLVDPDVDPDFNGAVGIYLRRGGVVARNRVRNIDAIDKSGLGIGGTFSFDDTPVLAHDNVVTMTFGGVAVACPEGRALLRGNVVFGEVNPGCRSAEPLSSPAASLPVTAETGKCRIVSALPAVISTRGVYCVAANLSTSIVTGNAITIAAADVTLDCLGHAIDGRSGGVASAATGISATGRSDVVVRGCSVLGFRHGIRLLQATAPAVPSGLVVEGNHVVASRQSGIIVQGDASVVRGNLVSIVGAYDAEVAATGIVAKYTVDVVDNRLIGLNGDGVTGILVASNRGGTIAGNRIRLGGYENATAIRLMPNTSQLVIAANFVASRPYFPTSTALRCAGADHRVSDNTAFGFSASAFSGCDDGGGNVQRYPDAP